MSEEFHALKNAHLGPRSQKQRKKDTLPVLVGKLQTKLGRKKNPQRIVILLDSGASASIMKESFAKKLRTKNDEHTSWTTAAGKLRTSQKCQTRFELPEVSNTMVIQTPIHLTKHLDRYDMIMGRDMMKELGIKLDFEHEFIHCQHVEVPMRSLTEAKNEEIHFYKVEESTPATEATQRIKKMLDAKHEALSLIHI